MDSTVVTASAAALGSLVGAMASAITALITQRAQSVRASVEWKLHERQTLYKEFITQASRLAIDAVTSSLERPDQIITLYSVLSAMRLVSGDEVVREGEAFCRRIIEQYGRPNLTTEQLRAAISSDQLDELDPLKGFSRACRNELYGNEG
jgi:hypothetical protein